MESIPQESSQNQKVSKHADLQNPLSKLHQFLHLDALITDICAALHELLQSGQVYTVFLDKLPLPEVPCPYLYIRFKNITLPSMA